MKAIAENTIRLLLSTCDLISITFLYVLYLKNQDSCYRLPFYGPVKCIQFFQFIPSFISFFNEGSLIASGFIIILVLTILSGRSYCSFLCPLGIGQDVFSRIGGRFRKKFRRFGFKKPFTILRYVILTITVIVTLIWGLYMITLLDPYSIFGRFMSLFIRPAILYINNFTAGILGKFDVYSLSHVPVKGFQLISYAIPFAFFLLIGTLSFTRGRLYCNAICPVGSLLGLMSKVSVLKIKFNESACTRCGRCSLGCKSSCIDSIKHTVDMSRCVVCFDCVSTCQEKAISYGFAYRTNAEHETDESRRKVVAASLFFLFGISHFVKGQEKTVPKPKKDSTVKEKKTFPVCPPGGIDIETFNKNCTSCSLCISACPNGVLQPAIKEYGIAGLMQPVMNYHRSFCTYNCVVCTEVCPTNALQPLALQAKKLTQIGRANFIKDNCIVKTEKTACGACSESCPTKAVYMIPYEGNLLIPEVNNEICVGCGHCEFACPTVPYKAIFVDGNPKHIAAKKPVNTEPEKEAPVDFPF